MHLLRVSVVRVQKLMLQVQRQLLLLTSRGWGQAPCPAGRTFIRLITVMYVHTTSFPVRLRRPIRRSRRVHRLLRRASHEKRRLLLRVDAESAPMGWTPIQSILY